MPASAPSGRNPHRPRAPRSATAQARGRFEIPEGITHIGERAFYEREDLQGTLVLCSTLKEVGEYAFYCCKGLTSIEIGKAVEVIGSSAFSCCKGLNFRAVNIPRSVQVAYDAFLLCGPNIRRTWW